MTETGQALDLHGTALDGVGLTGASLTRVDLTDGRVRSLDLTRARLRAVDLVDAHITGAEVINARIDGEIDGLIVNGVDVTAFVESELDRRDPERRKMSPTTADGFREAWAIIEQRWAETVERARGLSPALLHVQVDEEWSFIETLRHLAYATDAWIVRTVLGRPDPWHPLDLPWDEAPPSARVPHDRDVRPSLDEVLELRHDRMEVVRSLMASLTDEQLDTTTTPVDGPGWPPPDAYPIRTPLLIVLNEEWCHRQFAERDLARLTDQQEDR